MSENCKLKQQDTTRHLLEWPKSKTLTMLNASEDVKQQDLSFTDGVGMQNSTAPLEDSWAVSYKTYIYSYHTNQPYAPWYLPKWAENMSAQKSAQE